MKHNKTSILGIVLGIMGLLAGVQGAFASCVGNVYFRAPSDWTQAVFFVENGTMPKTVTTKDENGFFSVDLSTITQEPYMAKFGIANSTTNGAGNIVVLDSVWSFQNMYNQISNLATIPCPNSATAQVYVAEDALHPGSTYVGSAPPDAKFFYILLPEEKEWQSDDLMISYTTAQGVKKDTAMIPSPDYCGWHYMVFDTPPSDAVLYLKNNKDVQLGINGLWDDDGEADPIDLGTVFEAYGVEQLFFIPDDALWPDDGSGGWYVEYPNVEGTCTFSLAAIIYDSDQDLLNVFTSDPDASGFGACVGVHTGIVNEDLGPDGKPVFSGSPNAVKCFGTAQNFNMLFNYTPGVNEMQCYDMPFRHYGMDTRWGFDSDSTHYDADGNELAKGGFTGGFYPLENSTDAFVVVINGVPQGPTPNARKKRKADAPVPLLSEFADFYQSCNTPGWYGGIDCGATNEFNSGDNPAVWDWGNRENWTKMNDDKDLLRNQHFCMQSHATFTYNEDQEFTVIGDDDIWVFINRKLAIDNGGMHLPAPGHVVLKNLNTTYGAGFLVPGMDYPIDIFVCDRRTTMSNLNVKTNMFIKQGAGIDLATSRNSAGGLVMDICVENSGGGDCAAVALGSTGQEKTRGCSEEIDATITYSITTRKGEIPAGCADCSVLPIGMVVHGGIDLTNPKAPVIYPDRISGLAPGSYRLYIEVNGKKNYFPFIVKGGVGIVSQDVVFENIDNEVSAYPSGTRWKFASSGMAGTRVPIYISSPDDIGGVDLLTASGQSYTLTLTAGATLYKTNDPADMTPVVTPYAGVVNETGIDTLWVEVPLAGIVGSSQTVTASVGNTSATITFYAPVLTFAEPATKDSEGNVLTWNPVLKDPDYKEDGSSEYYHWVGADVDLYVVVVNPATGDLCRECNFPIDVLDASNGIVGNVSQFDDGVALVRIRSNNEFSDETASVTVGSIENNTITAPYGNMRFYTPTSPIPVVVDIFDVKGKPLGQMNIPSEFYSETADYLDGRADSLAIIYDRKIHEDSIPTFICLNFDEKNLKKINPYEMGISNNSKDKEMYCSTQFDADDVKKAYERSPDGGRTLVFSVDEPFSAGVKTSVNPENKIVSFTKYIWKGKEVRTFCEKSLTDRMAPIILSAHVSTETYGGSFSQLTIVTSEPVWVRENVESVWNMGDSESVWAKGDVDSTFANTAFSFYLNSATQLPGAERYRHVKSLNRPGNGKDTLVLRYDLTDDENPPPHVGDYIRFRSDTYMWADATNGYAPGCDTLRPASDADMFWNAPTNYNSIDRLPSPWVVIKCDSEKVNPDNPDVEFAAPSFRIKMTGPFQFTIVMDEEISSKASKFTVMDLQGRVVRQGVIAAKETAVPLLSKGSYIVKVGFGYRRVNVR